MIYHEKMKSIYEERVASAASAWDFAAIWYFIVLVNVILATALWAVIVGADWDFEWIIIVAIWVILDVFIVFFCLRHYFKGDDVRFWDPLVYLSKDRRGKIDVEEIRKLHKSHEETLDMLMGFSMWAWDIIFLLAISLLLFLE